ncbi:LysE family transporter, partial [Saccharothrix sp. MB29]|nr:LysE family transporter [Saccharothrix sp. MB29]
VVERSVVVFTALKLAGAAYLVHLGVRAVRRRGELTAPFACGAAARGGPRTLWEGFAVGVANPKTLVFFAAVLLVGRPGGPMFRAAEVARLAHLAGIVSVVLPD